MIWDQINTNQNNNKYKKFEMEKIPNEINKLGGERSQIFSIVMFKDHIFCNL
jgi:hypothetical protein